MPTEIVKRVVAYKYEELSDDAKQKALEAMYDINVDYEWWDFTLEDAMTIGLKITDFDNYHGTISGSFTENSEDVVKLIHENHGKGCATYKTATEYEGTLVGAEDEEVSDRVEAFEYALLQDYLSILRKEYEYLTSEKAIVETIQANEYDFTVDGHFPAI